mgnify:CR=1 FL=1
MYRLATAVCRSVGHSTFDSNNYIDTVPLFPDVNAIVETWQDHNVTTEDTVDLIDTLIQMVYQSSPNVEQDPYACNTGGLSQLSCPSSTTPLSSLPFVQPIRAVTTAGMFVPDPIVADEHWKTSASRQAFYTAADIAQKAATG